MNTTIKSKLFRKTLAVTIIAFGIIAATCSLVAGWILYDHLTEEYESKAVAIGNIVTTSIPEIFLKNDAATVQSIIDQYLVIQGVAYALVKNEQGEIIAHTFSPNIPGIVLGIVARNTPRIDPETGLMGTSLLQTPSYLDVCSPILMGKAGYVHIGMDMGLINTYIFNAIVKMQVILAGVLVVCVILTFFFIRRISRPLTTLTDYANLLADQHFDALVPISSNDEIGLLAQTMQSMAHRINDLVRGLEHRTRKLEASNTLLRKEIQNSKAMDDALQREKELFSTTLRSITDGVITLDNNGKVLLINQAMVDLGGWTTREVKGRQFCSVFKITLNDKTLYLNRSSQDRMTLKRLETEQDALFITRDGRTLEIALRVLPLYDKRSMIKGQVLIMRDISEEKRLESERLKTEKLESIGILAGGIAHDFNNILTAVLNYIILAMKDPGMGRVPRTQLEKARKAGLRAQQLTQQLLTFSKGGAPILELTGIQDLIADSVTFALRGSNVKTRIFISPDIWNAEIDPGQIAQVIENLAINADQAMPKGGNLDITAKNVSVDVHAGLPLQAGQYIRIDITDQGPGIAPENLKKIFDPYFTTKKTGSGLGLATTYSIIKNHNGHIDVISRQGHGTTFSIFLPASEGEYASTSVVTPAQTTSGQGTILLMDDDESIREVMEETLGFLGYEVITASDGVEALHIYEHHIEARKRIDLVIMDLTIPGGMGGKETVGKVLELDPDAKVIVSSGYSQDPVMADYESYGFIDILAKPYTLEEVSRKISQILGRTSAS